MARRAFVYGYPVAHSLSPPIHNAAFRASGLEAVYDLREVAPGELARAVEDLRAEDVLGANITVPHKVAVIGLVDGLDEPAEVIGAANTLYKRDGRLRATNTDAEGFGRSLGDIGLDPRGMGVLLLGAGGSARAVGYALLNRGPASLLIANRTLERGERLAAELGARFPGARVGAVGLDSIPPARARECGLIVNTTTVGMHGEESPLRAELLPPEGAVVDIIYYPARTPLLQQAQAAGLRTLNGLPMLVYQAAAAWEVWTGQAAPVDKMFEAAAWALEERERARRGR